VPEQEREQAGHGGDLTNPEQKRPLHQLDEQGRDIALDIDSERRKLT
jgi:hypothetical protein